MAPGLGSETFGERMTIDEYLAARGLMQNVIRELRPYIPNGGDEGAFYDATSIMDPDRWFYWPGRTRFILVGQCPNGDGIAIDTQKQPGAVFYVAHELVGSDRPLEETVIRVAGSPSDFVQKFLRDDFPYDYWEARVRITETGVLPNRRPASRQTIRRPRKGGGR